MPSSVKKKRKSQIPELRKLVEHLSDRDIKIKRDILLFEEFFENFPIPVSIWSITNEGAIVSQRGNGLICQKAKCIESLFMDFDDREFYIEAHKSALKGISHQGITKKEDKVFFVTVAPRRDESTNVSGVLGLAWDVTPNQTILDSLKKIIDMSEEFSLEDAKKEAKKALSVSRLNKLLVKKGE